MHGSYCHFRKNSFGTGQKRTVPLTFSSHGKLLNFAKLRPCFVIFSTLPFFFHRESLLSFFSFFSFFFYTYARVRMIFCTRQHTRIVQGSCTIILKPRKFCRNEDSIDSRQDRDLCNVFKRRKIADTYRYTVPPLFLPRTSMMNRASLWQWLPRRGCRFTCTRVSCMPSIFVGHCTKQCYEYLIHNDLQKNTVLLCIQYPVSFVLPSVPRRFNF